MDCSGEGCDRQAVAHGWCLMHYKRWRKWGDAEMVHRPNTIAGILSRFVTTETGCKEWVGARNRAGYGKATFSNRTFSVHRLAWEETHGPIPEGLFVCHTCDNPPCINVEHLFVGPPKANYDDMVAKGRRSYARRSLTPEQVAYVRASTKTQTALGAELGVGQQIISGILTGKTYKNV